MKTKKTKRSRREHGSVKNSLTLPSRHASAKKKYISSIVKAVPGTPFDKWTTRGSRMFVRCGVFFFTVDRGCLLGVGYFFTVSRIFFTFLRVNFSRIFPFLRVNFSRENNLRSRMFVRCGVFFFEIADVC